MKLKSNKQKEIDALEKKVNQLEFYQRENKYLVEWVKELRDKVIAEEMLQQAGLKTQKDCCEAKREESNAKKQRLKEK